MNRRAALMGVGAVGAVALVCGTLLVRHALELPPATEPEGAYLRIAASVSSGNVRAVFDYLDDGSRDGIDELRDSRKRARDLVAAHFPEPEREKLLGQYDKIASAPDAASLFVVYAEERGFVSRLRRDLSGVASVRRADDHATIVTARGTEYEFTRRGDGVWGLALFTADITAEADRAAKDFEVVQRASDDYAAAHD